MVRGWTGRGNWTKLPRGGLPQENPGGGTKAWRFVTFRGAPGPGTIAPTARLAFLRSAQAPNLFMEQVVNLSFKPAAAHPTVPARAQSCWEEGTPIYRAGEAGGAWRVTAGSVRLDTTAGTGEGGFASLAVAGDIIGTETLLFGAYAFSAAALTHCVLVPWPEGVAVPAGQALLESYAVTQRRAADVVALRGGQAADRVLGLVRLLARESAGRSATGAAPAPGHRRHHLPAPGNGVPGAEEPGAPGGAAPGAAARGPCHPQFRRGFRRSGRRRKRFRGVARGGRGAGSSRRVPRSGRCAHLCRRIPGYAAARRAKPGPGHRPGPPGRRPP